MSKIPDTDRIEELSEKWLSGKITKAEQEEYDRWYSSFEDCEVNDLLESDFIRLENRIYHSIKEKVHLGSSSAQRKKWQIFKKIALAAACVGLFITATFHFFSHPSPNEKEKSEALYTVIKPGTDRAKLSFDNGLVFDLDSLDKGQIFQKSGIRIEKNDKGELIYSVINSSVDPTDILKNTISTPNGGQYRVCLPDGSLVWLNAASKLTFPTLFTGDSRIVELSGEAYFEVATKKNLPFKVITAKEEVEVLGTHFNVNSYQEEETSAVSLLEGKVKVSFPSSEEKVLKPGEQVVANKDFVSVRSVDLTEVVAWKNGEFMFNNENIKSVMQKVARWYDIEVVLSPELEEILIWGAVSKYESIHEVLRIIEMTGLVHFKIEGRRVYVMK